MLTRRFTVTLRAPGVEGDGVAHLAELVEGAVFGLVGLSWV